MRSKSLRPNIGFNEIRIRRPKKKPGMTLAEKKAKAKAEAEAKQAAAAKEAQNNLFAKLLGKTVSVGNSIRPK